MDTKEFKLILSADTTALGLILLRQLEDDNTTYMALDSTTVHIEDIDCFDTLTKTCYVYLNGELKELSEE